MNSVILKMIRKFSLSEQTATKLVKESFLYESLLLYPEETMHDDIEETANTIYQDYLMFDAFCAHNTPNIN